MVKGITYRTEDATEKLSGFKAIKKVRGQIASIQVVEKQGFDKPVIEVGMKEACVLEMFPDEMGQEQEPMLFENGEWSFIYNYSTSSMSGWVQGFLRSCEDIGFELPDNPEAIDGGDVGSETCVVIEKKEFPLLDKKGNQLKKRDTQEPMTATNFVIVEIEKAGKTMDRLLEVMVGKDVATAKRMILTDQALSKSPDILSAVRNGTIADLAGVKIEDGVYVVA